MTEPIDWPGIRAAAVTIGVREAARQAGQHLPPGELKRFTDRVMQRCHREGWIREKKRIIQEPPPITTSKPLSAKVSNGADSLVNHLAQKKEKSRLNLAKFVVNASSVAAKSRKPLAIAQDVRHVSAVMQALWPEEGSKGLTLNLGVAIGGMQ